MNTQNHEQTRWLDLIEDIDSLTKLSTDIWKQKQSQPQYNSTGYIDLDFKDILKLNPQEVPFHTQAIGEIGQTLHTGMVKNNQIKRHEFEKEHKLHKQKSLYKQFT